MQKESKRSLLAEERSFIRFINKTKREVNVHWWNYEGLPVKYSTLKPGAYYDADTYVTHPWTFEDRESRDRLVVNNQHVFFPPSWPTVVRDMRLDPEHYSQPHRLPAVITIPVFSLRERCLQVVRDYLDLPEKVERLSELQLPKSVEDDLIIMILRKDGRYI